MSNKVAIISPARNEKYVIPEWPEYVQGFTGYVYVITNEINGKRYVGQTRQFVRRRWNGHCQNERAGETALYAAFRKYGIQNFKFEVIAVLQSRELTGHMDGVEMAWIKMLNTLAPNGYNLHSGGRGGSLSPEHKHKLSIAHLGKKPSPETRARMSATRKGRPLSARHLEAIRHSDRSHIIPRRGFKISDKQKAQVSAIHKGKVLSAETRAKISASVKRWLEEKKLGKT